MGSVVKVPEMQTDPGEEIGPEDEVVDVEVRLVKVVIPELEELVGIGVFDDKLVDSLDVDVTVPAPTQSARSASPVRLAKRPLSQSDPSQGFQACNVLTVRL